MASPEAPMEVLENEIARAEDAIRILTGQRNQAMDAIVSLNVEVVSLQRANKALTEKLSASAVVSHGE